MVGQLLEIRLELKANWMQKFPWKRTKNNKKNKPQNTPQQAPNNNNSCLRSGAGKIAGAEVEQ